MSQGRYELGTVEAAEELLQDLYVTLRRSLAKWAAVTNQTPQARMGYVGQHLTSVVTGFPGGRSGARGKDLLLPGDRFAEIKTCSRVDQLGACRSCRHAVASIEVACPSCGSESINRRDDSKWLIGLRSESELHALWEAEAFYLVLFDFADFADQREIKARIWQVDPRSPGFAYCMVDYFFNIRGIAPFNLWPFSFKFELMVGELIYSALIHEDDSITTEIFPDARGEPVPIGLRPLQAFSRSKVMSTPALEATADELGVPAPGAGRGDFIAAIQKLRDEEKLDESRLRDCLARQVYLPGIQAHLSHLP